jgi:predicted enzyme related to lactoylglutathione lyase
VVSLGGKIELPVSPVPGGPTIAIFSDLDGNLIGVLQRESFSK